MNNIQGLNKDSDLFQDENRNNIGELKETNEEVTTSNAQDKKKDPKVKRVVIDFNSQHDDLLKVEEATKTIIMDKIKLSTCDLCNDAAKRSDKVHEYNVLVKFINRMNMMHELDETATLLEK